MSLDILRFLQLRQNILREDFSKLNTHLVKRVDTPNDTLSEDLVFVKGDQSTKSGWSQFGEENTIARSVPAKDL